MYSYYITHLPTGITQRFLTSSNKLVFPESILTVYTDSSYEGIRHWVDSAFHWLRKDIWNENYILLSRPMLIDQCEISIQDQEYE